MADYLLGIDAGTSVVKACIMDQNGNELATANQKVPVENPDPLYAEQDMYKVWQGVVATIPEVLQKSGIPAEKVAGVGVTAQGDGSWLVDQNGNPVGPAILWSDGRAGEIVNRWMKEGLVDKAYDITGTGPYAGSSNAILRWRLENQPELLKKAHKNIWCMDWVEYNLTGNLSTDESNPSLFGLDIHNRTYSDEVLDIYGLQEIKHLLPEMVQSLEIVGHITSEASRATGLVEGTPVIKGMFDQPACAAGVGAINPGDATTTMGTTCFNMAVYGEPAFQPRNVGMSICHGAPGRWVKALGVNYGTPNLDWFLREFGDCYQQEAESRGVKVYQILEDVLERTPAGSAGVVYSPYLCQGGERAPFVKPDARAQFFGLTETHTRDHMLRAVYEGVGFSMRDSYEELPGQITDVRLSGGGAQSEGWCQMLADITGMNLQVPSGTEFGAKGVAIFAGVAVGLFNSLDEAVANTVHYERRYQPNPANKAKYDALYKVYRKLRDDVWETWDLLAEARKQL